MTPELPPMPRPARLVGLVLSGAVVVSALAGAVLAATVPAKPGWMMVGFEVVGAICGAFALATCLGRFRSGPGLSLACMGGLIFATSFLGMWVSMHRNLGRFSLDDIVLGRTAAGAGIALCGAWAVLARRSGSVAMVAKGAVLGVAALIGAGACWKWRGSALFRAAEGEFAEAGRVLAIVAIFIAVLALLCAGVHFVVRAFERTIERA